MSREVAPHIYVIFGATGDRTYLKILPALYNITARPGVG